MPGNCSFNILWLEKAEYREWLELDPKSKHRAKCVFCSTSFCISKMGESALKSHMDGKKHKELLALRKNSTLISTFVKKDNHLNIEKEKNLKDAPAAAATSSSLTNFLVSSDVQNAEILWALKSMMSHFSYRSSNELEKLFATMFPDSSIASKFSCSEKKLAYICCFGLAPHFQKLLSDTFDQCDFFTVLFDETLNHSRQEKQLDVHIRFYHPELNEVCTRYYTSVFLGHSTAEDILQSFLQCTEELKLNKIIQVSMDGPSVNWAFYTKLQNKVKSDYGEEILNLGTCGLHIVNNAFKHGQSVTLWDVSSLLNSLYYLFKDCPARRDDFLKIATLKKFPLKFVNHRWLESVPCTERALEIWPDLKSFVEKVNKGKAKILTKSFFVVEKAVNDILMPCKLSFFLSFAKCFYPFLTLYQSDNPLLPFLAEDILNIVKQSLSMYNIIKSDEVEKLTVLKLCKFDFHDQDNYRPVTDISAGYCTDKLLKELKKDKKVSESELNNFKIECRNFIIETLNKLMEKITINYSIVRNLVCLDPRAMVKQKTSCISKMQKVLEKLEKIKKIDSASCEKVMAQYRSFLDNAATHHFSEFANFNLHKVRLDKFLSSYMANHNDLWLIVKCLLILSHGQAAVERGFSINKHIEVENLKTHSYISQKVIYDHITFFGGVLNVNITKELKDSVSSARKKYMLYLEEERSKNSNKMLSGKRKEIENELNSLKKKKRKTEQDIEELEKRSDALAAEAEACKDIDRFIKVNELRKLAKQRKEELSEINTQIDEKTIELKN